MRRFVFLWLFVCASAVVSQSAHADTIDVSMSEYKLRMPVVLYLDDTVFRIHNRGTIPHNFLIHNEDSTVFYYFSDGEGGLDNLMPGEKRIMVTRMLDTNYAYKAMCPLDEHDDAGMVEYFQLARSFRPKLEAVEPLPDVTLNAEVSASQINFEFNMSMNLQVLSIVDVRGSQVYSRQMEPGRSHLTIDRSLLGSGLRFVRIGRQSLKLFLTP